jgi:hypothetical protein
VERQECLVSAENRCRSRRKGLCGCALVCEVFRATSNVSSLKIAMSCFNLSDSAFDDRDVYLSWNCERMACK